MIRTELDLYEGPSLSPPPSLPSPCDQQVSGAGAVVVLSEAEKQRLEQLLAQDEDDDTETEVRDQPLYDSPTLTDITNAVGIII